MKHILITTIAAVVLVGCSKPPPPDISIHKAAKDGNITAVRQHLAAGTYVDVKGDQDGWTALCVSAFLGHKEIAELLIANGADVNAKNGDSHTPLHQAFKTQYNKELIELLIANGADVNAKDDRGRTPLDYAIRMFPGQKLSKGGVLLRKHGGKTGEELKAEGK